VRQDHAILSLHDDWKAVFRFIIEKYQGLHQYDRKHQNYMQEQLLLSPADLKISYRELTQEQYSREVSARHLPAILRRAISASIQFDIDNYNFKHNFETLAQFKAVVYTNLIKQLDTQNWRCFYMSAPLTIANLWTRFSIERIGTNQISHFTPKGELGTTVIICRLFNSARKLSCKKILGYVLTQTSLEVPGDVRDQIENDIATAGTESEPKLKKPRTNGTGPKTKEITESKKRARQPRDLRPVVEIAKRIDGYCAVCGEPAKSLTSNICRNIACVRRKKHFDNTNRTIKIGAKQPPDIRPVIAAKDRVLGWCCVCGDAAKSNTANICQDHKCYKRKHNFDAMCKRTNTL
jgi:hypothetical protein